MRTATARTVALEPGVDPLRLAPVGASIWSRGERAVVAWGEHARVEPGSGDGRFARGAEELGGIMSSLEIDDEVGGWATGPLALGAYTFDPDSASSLLVVPRVVVGREGRRAWMTTVGEGAIEPPRPNPPISASRSAVRREGSSVDEQRWLASVATARGAVLDGLIDKVVLARDVFVSRAEPFDDRVIARRLARSFPECFTFSFDGMVGATPELLVRRAGERVGSLVLAGSVARGRDADEDARLARWLLSSAKDRREHDLAVQTVSEALESVCQSVEVDDEPSVLALSYVQHLSTSVSARDAKGRSALDLAGVLHPTAAVCGVPTDKALAAIRELEDLDRGRYCGPVGWIDASGDGEWAIALRCAEVRGREARLFAGAGIMGDSDPQLELEETELKLRPLLDALHAPL